MNSWIFLKETISLLTFSVSLVIPTQWSRIISSSAITGFQIYREQSGFSAMAHPREGDVFRHRYSFKNFREGWLILIPKIERTHKFNPHKNFLIDSENWIPQKTEMKSTRITGWTIVEKSSSLRSLDPEIAMK
jgi:hypothetical protein